MGHDELLVLQDCMVDNIFAHFEVLLANEDRPFRFKS